MLTAQRRHQPTSQRGFTMLESLITVLILAFGLLALGGLQARLLTAEMESYQRSQAILLLNDMASKIQVNRANAATYVGDFGTGDALPADCSGQALGKDQDVCEWSNALKGAAEVSGGGSNIGAMIGARGCVEQVAAATATTPLILRISVAWQGMNRTVAPSLTCGQDEYGADDAYRRAISQIVAAADL